MKKKKYFIYARSEVKPKKGEYSNTNTQIQRLKGFAEHFEMEVVDVFKDYGSGLSAKRPGLMRMLKRLRKREAQGILCTNWYRLTRDFVMFVRLKVLLEQYNIELILLDEEDEDLEGFTYALYMKKNVED